MKTWGLASLAATVAAVSIAGAQSPTLRITSPEADTLVSGPSRLEALIEPADAARSVESVTFFANGRLVCSADHPPFGCPWDPGEVVRGHHIRVVATFADGKRLVQNVRTKDLGYVEQVRAEAVLVPVIVTDHGNFVRGLKQQDFELFEDGVRQPIASLASESSPLDLVLAIDVSGSMEAALGEVKAAVKQLLSKLRPGDAATLLGFNDITFTVAEREKDARVREQAVDLLSSWGGTALYDATVRVLDLVSRDWGRKGVVIFSDGEDRNSLTSREAAMARVQASDAMLYTVGFGGGATEPRLRSSLESYARATGGRPFFPRNTKELDGVFDEIVADLANQYVLSYASTNLSRDQGWRNIKVRIRTGKYDIRARQGYQVTAPRPAGRE
ncbi:MAG: VWA domain-containing protein [Acidobacteriota bacterium]